MPALHGTVSRGLERSWPGGETCPAFLLRSGVDRAGLRQRPKQAIFDFIDAVLESPGVLRVSQHVHDWLFPPSQQVSVFAFGDIM